MALLAVMHFATLFFLVEKKLPPLDSPVQTKGHRRQSHKVITRPFLPWIMKNLFASSPWITQAICIWTSSPNITTNHAYHYKRCQVTPHIISKHLSQELMHLSMLSPRGSRFKGHFTTFSCPGWGFWPIVLSQGWVIWILVIGDRFRVLALQMQLKKIHSTPNPVGLIGNLSGLESQG